MALTTAQKIRVYEVLGVTYGPGGGDNANYATIHNHLGIELTLTEMDTLRDALSTYLETLDADVETEIESLLDEWEGCRLLTVKMDGGGTDGVDGVTVDPEAMRRRVRELMQQYIPVMSIAQSVKRRQGPESPAHVTFMR